MTKPSRLACVFVLFVLVGAAGIFYLLSRQVLEAEPREFDGGIALHWVVAQEKLGARTPGSEAHQSIQAIIVSELSERQWQAQIEPCVVREGIIAYNIIGKQGSGENWIILGAHYDSRLSADEEQNQESRQLPVPGANDGASGVAVLLEMARVLSSHLENTEIWLVFFDLEDNGRLAPYGDWILGSTCFVSQLQERFSGRSPTAAIIVDMIGDKDLQIYYEVNSSQDIRQAIWAQANQLGYSQFIPKERFSMIDDHSPFLAAGIPAVDIIDFNYPYWHTLNDTSDKVSAESLEAVGRTLQEWLQTR